MNFLDPIKNFGKKTKNFLTPNKFKDIHSSLECKKGYAKNTKEIKGGLTLTTKAHLKIDSITYEIKEQVDPIIGKKKENAEILGVKKTRKGFTIKPDQEKKVEFTVPIKRLTSTEESQGDMRLLNEMSERSKKTVINYALEISIIYHNKDEKGDKAKDFFIRHDIWFE